MKNKVLNKRFYLGISMVLVIYLLDSIMYLEYNAIY